ncbi:TPA: hypothetical protein EYP66_09085 [Candidatus Poribacteria bacterium]|nr:hypothetical protein [Candidatus Poribacteria bacterium]
MLGVQLLGNGKVAVKEYPDPNLTGNQILIKVKDSGICGSEIKSFLAPNLQEFNDGHEVTGVVIDSGKSQRFKIGDRVGVHAVWGCGNCRWCVAGQYTYCDNRDSLLGAHAELVAAPDHVCLKLPDDVAFDVGVLLSGDGMGVPYHVSKRLNTKGGDFVCIVGVGPIGLGNAMMQSFLGAEVIAIDINDYRLSLAKELGAAHTVNAQQTDPVEAVREITHGMLADKCIEAVGKVETVKVALKLVGKAGAVVTLGEQGDVPVNISGNLIRYDVTLMGSWFYHYAEYPAIVDLYRRGLPVAKLITDHFPLTEAQTAFTRFANGQAGKVMLEP